MKKFEYTSVFVVKEISCEELNKLGSEGWELVSVESNAYALHPVDPCHSTIQGIRMIFKREIQEKEI